MSVYIKINSWFGSDQEDVSRRFTKVFRMSQVEGDSAMAQIIQDQPWQFDHRTSDSQSSEAQEYLTGLGFEVDLIPVSDIDWEAADSAAMDGGVQELEEVEKLPGKPGRKLKSRLIAAMAVVLLLLVGAGGLSQTQFGKDLINSIGSQSIGTPPDVDKGSPASLPDQPTGTETPKTLSTAKPLQPIVLQGDPSKKYPMTLSGCLKSKNQLNPILRRADLEQTQSDLLCKGKTIANPQTEWKCEFLPLSTICEPYEAYSCSMQYQCVPETPDYNREKFKKALEALS